MGEMSKKTNCNSSINYGGEICYFHTVFLKCSNCLLFRRICLQLTALRIFCCGSRKSKRQ